MALDPTDLATLQAAQTTLAKALTAATNALNNIKSVTNQLNALAAEQPPVPPPVVTPPPTPNPTPVGAFANEPAGFTLIEDQPWDTTLPAGWAFDYNSGPSFSIVQDATAPISPPNVIAGDFPAGSPGGSGPFYLWRRLPSVSKLYLGIAVKMSANWDNTGANNGPGNAGTKFLWPACDQIQGTSTYLSFDGQTMDFLVIQQNGPDREMGANLVPLTQAQFLGLRGQWVIFELLLQANSAAGAADGKCDVWINGVHTHSYSDVAWAGQTWQSLAWNPTYGGGSLPVPHDQQQYIDHIRISGQ